MVTQLLRLGLLATLIETLELDEPPRWCLRFVLLHEFLVLRYGSQASMSSTVCRRRANCQCSPSTNTSAGVGRRL